MDTGTPGPAPGAPDLSAIASQKDAQWKPTGDQMRYALATVQLGAEASVPERARLARVHVREARQWMRDEHFCVWLERTVAYVQNDKVATVWNAVYHRAVANGDMRAAELYLKKFDPDGIGEGVTPDVTQKRRIDELIQASREEEARMTPEERRRVGPNVDTVANLGRKIKEASEEAKED